MRPRSRQFAPTLTIVLAKWRDLPFLHFRAANMILQASITLFRARLLPRSMLPAALRLANRLANRGAEQQARLLRRRIWG
jgi:hypothetical protein